MLSNLKATCTSKVETFNLTFLTHLKRQVKIELSMIISVTKPTPQSCLKFQLN